MRKRRYRSVPVKDVDLERLRDNVADVDIVVGVDVAKEEQFATVMKPDLSVVTLVRWKQPHEQSAFVSFVLELKRHAKSVAVAMEPSGVYGDCFRVALLGHDVDVHRVSPKRSHDAAEVYDGVPSLHDAKSASIVAKLFLDGASEKWPMRSEHERQLDAALRVVAVYQKEFRRNRDRLESLLSRYWPELALTLELGSATLLELLIEFPSPRAVAQRPKDAHALMVRVGGRFMDEAKVARVVRQASKSVGVPMIDDEMELVRVVAQECRRHQGLSRKALRHVERLIGKDQTTELMADVVGRATAAVLVASVGHPQRYASSSAYVKSLGLNLREYSSGRHKKGAKHLTKRGPGIARMFLYMAALRLIQKDRVVRAWYGKKVRRQGDTAKLKAVVAVMRKLAGALWYVASGEPFDATLLFDVSRLKLAEEAHM